MAEAAKIEQVLVESDLSWRKIRLATIITIANMFATNLLAFGAITLVNVPMTGEFGWTQSQYSWSTTALMWCGSLALPFYGRFIDRLGVRPLILFGTIGCGLTTLAMSFMTGSLWQFYLCFALLGLFGSTAIGYTKVVSALFTQHRGKAMAILGVESTLASAGIPPLLNWWITDFGWRGMFMICAIIIFVLLPVIYLTLDEPGERNSARQKRIRRESKSRKTPVDLEGLTVGQILRDRVYWLIIIATVIGTAPRTGMQPFLVPMLLEKGFTQADAVTYLSVMTMIAPFGTLVGGWAVDRIHDARIALPFQLISFIGLLVFTIASASIGGFPLLMVAVGFGGFSFGTARPIGTYLHIRFFGLKSFGFYHGFESAFLAFSMGAAPPIVALLREGSGSYTSGYVMMLVMLALGGSLYALLGRYRYAADIGAVVVPPAGQVNDQRQADGGNPAQAGLATG